MSRAHDRWRAYDRRFGGCMTHLEWSVRPSARRPRRCGPMRRSTGRCLWRPGLLELLHQRAPLAGVFSIAPADRLGARWRRCRRAAFLASPMVDFATWGECEPAKLEQWQLELQRAMWNAFQVLLHLVGLSEPTALERLRDRERILGHAVEFVDGPPPDGDTHFTVGRFEDLGRPSLRYASKRVDVPPFDGSIGPA